MTAVSHRRYLSQLGSFSELKQHFLVPNTVSMRGLVVQPYIYVFISRNSFFFSIQIASECLEVRGVLPSLYQHSGLCAQKVTEQIDEQIARQGTRPPKLFNKALR